MQFDNVLPTAELSSFERWYSDTAESSPFNILNIKVVHLFFCYGPHIYSIFQYWVKHFCLPLGISKLLNNLHDFFCTVYF